MVHVVIYSRFLNHFPLKNLSDDYIWAFVANIVFIIAWNNCKGSSNITIIITVSDVVASFFN